ncbi:hypothetical protein Tco_1476910 [Tanacetum coccineum]
MHQRFSAINEQGYKTLLRKKCHFLSEERVKSEAVRNWMILLRLAGSVMDEAHASRYLVHPGADKTYYNFGDMYWESHVEKDIATYTLRSVRNILCLLKRMDNESVMIQKFRRINDGSVYRFWCRDWESSLIGLELVLETTDKVVLVKEKPKAVLPWKGVVRFRKMGKLAPRYVGPFEILERVGLVAYRLRLHEELNNVHDTFHVSNLKKCLADANLHVPLDEIKVDKTLCFVKEPVEIIDREVKRLKRRKIVLVKLAGNSKRGPEFTWEHEDQMRIKLSTIGYVDRVLLRRGYWDLGDISPVSAPVVATTKIPVLNLGEFKLWKMRIEQYFLMTDYALWDAQPKFGEQAPIYCCPQQPAKSYSKSTNNTSKSLIEHSQGQDTSNDLLLTNTGITIHMLVERKYPLTQEMLSRMLSRRLEVDHECEMAYGLFRFTRSQLKKYSSLPSYKQDSYPRRSCRGGRYKLIDRIELEGKRLGNLELFRLQSTSETEVKGSSSSNQNSQNVAFVSSNNSGSSKQAHGSNSANTDSMGDDVIYSFFANQSNSPQLDNEDLQQIDVDDLEEMDLKWQMAMLTMRARRFLNKTGRKINSNGFETIRENKNREPVRRNVTVETTETKALVTQDGLGYDWSDQAKEGPTNFALMAYTSSGSSSSSSSDSESQLNVVAYKTGLESVEARLDVYKKNEVVFKEDIKILKLDVKLRDNELTELRKKFEKAKKERDDLKLTLEKFENSSKNISKLLEIQVSDKFKTGVGYDSQVVDSQVFDSQVNDKHKTGEGYHAIPPPYTRNFMPPKPNLVLADKEEYNDESPKFSDYEEIDGGFVAFGGDSKGSKITGKDTKCVVLSLDFKLLDENYVLLRVPRKDNMYSVDLKNIVPSGEAVSSPMVSAAKLPLLNPGEFELWKMRIEQHFLMTDYDLWEVIVNGDSPLPKRTVNGVKKTYPPTTVEEKLARKNELKARGTLLMDLPNEHQLKFNTYKCAKSLMEAIEKRFGGNKKSNKTQKTLLKQ